MEKSQAINDIKVNFNIMKMFRVEDILEALLLEDTAELEKMRAFITAEDLRLADIETSINFSDDKAVDAIVGTFKRDVYRK